MSEQILDTLVGSINFLISRTAFLRYSLARVASTCDRETHLTSIVREANP